MLNYKCNKKKLICQEKNENTQVKFRIPGTTDAGGKSPTPFGEKGDLKQYRFPSTDHIQEQKLYAWMNEQSPTAFHTTVGSIIYI